MQLFTQHTHILPHLHIQNLSVVLCEVLRFVCPIIFETLSMGHHLKA